MKLDLLIPQFHFTTLILRIGTPGYAIYIYEWHVWPFMEKSYQTRAKG